MSLASPDRSKTTFEVTIGSVKVVPTIDDAYPTWDSREGSKTTAFESPLRDTSNHRRATIGEPVVTSASHRVKLRGLYKFSQAGKH